MSVWVRSIGTAVPATVLRQPDVRDLLAAQPGVTRLGRRLIHASFDASGIDTRRSVLAELEGSTAGVPATYVEPVTGQLLAPSTGVRNEAYTRAAPELFLSAAKEALAGADGLRPGDVTHVVTVSCTGFFSPGPDHLIVRGLGLAFSTRRFHLGFMGCYGAFPALQLASSVCTADPGAVVLIVCAELCTLHVHSSNDLDAIVASSVFGDGAAAAVVTAHPGERGAAGLEVLGLETALTPDGETDMAWTIGDQGFDMVLSPAVPKLLGRHLAAALRPLWRAGARDADPATITRWAVHPGGRSILDQVQRVLELSDEQLAPSRAVLREYGNMSSATVWFILREHLLAAPAAEPEQVAAMAFGPGLTVESALFTRPAAA